jgi:hypothetical protein
MHLEDNNPLFIYLLNLYHNDALTNGTFGSNTVVDEFAPCTFHMAGSDAVFHNKSCSLPCYRFV